MLQKYFLHLQRQSVLCPAFSGQGLKANGVKSSGRPAAVSPIKSFRQVRHCFRQGNGKAAKRPDKPEYLPFVMTRTGFRGLEPCVRIEVSGRCRTHSLTAPSLIRV